MNIQKTDRRNQVREKIKYIVIGVVVAFGLYFAYSFYAQVQRNSKNIDAIANFLSKPQQTQTASAKAPVKKENINEKE